jgi:hypothetical protein
VTLRWSRTISSTRAWSSSNRLGADEETQTQCRNIHSLAVCVVAFVIAAVFVRVNSGNPTLRLSPVTVLSGGMIDVGWSRFEGSQATLLFRGRSGPCASATLVLRVPRGTAQGRYFVVVLTTVGGYPGDIEKPFFVQ